jgi:hypothetical protein
MILWLIDDPILYLKEENIINDVEYLIVYSIIDFNKVL